MIREGQRVRFSPAAVARVNTGADGKPLPNPTPLPAPSETFVVQAIHPWTDGSRKEHFDEDAWADLGPGHSMVSIRLLEPA